MKKILIFIGTVFALVAVGVAIFIATFDADRYRGQVVSRMETAVGKPVRIDHLSLTWHGGIALQARKLAIYPDKERKEKPEIEIEKVSILVRLLPLIKKNLQAHLVCEQVASPQLANPIRELTMEVLLKPGQVDLKSLLVKVARGKVIAKGIVEHLESNPKATLQVTAEKLSLQELLPSVSGGEPQLHGTLSASFQGIAYGLSVEDIRRTITGTGRLQLTDGVIVDLNILRDVFQRISTLPGLVEILQARLPESYRERMTRRDTILKPLDASADVSNGMLHFEHLTIATDMMELAGEGRLGPDGMLVAPMKLRIEPELSAALVKGVHELQGLINPSGQFELPVLLQGKLPQITVVPDMQYVVAHLATDVVGGLLEGVFNKLLKKESSHEKSGGP